MVRVARYPLSAHGKRRIVIGMVSVDRAVLQPAPIASARRDVLRVKEPGVGTASVP